MKDTKIPQEARTGLYFHLEDEEERRAYEILNQLSKKKTKFISCLILEFIKMYDIPEYMVEDKKLFSHTVDKFIEGDLNFPASSPYSKNPTGVSEFFENLTVMLKNSSIKAAVEEPHKETVFPAAPGNNLKEAVPLEEETVQPEKEDLLHHPEQTFETALKEDENTNTDQYEEFEDADDPDYANNVNQNVLNMLDLFQQ